MNGLETEVVVALTPPNRGDDQKGGACRREQARMGWRRPLSDGSPYRDDRVADTGTYREDKAVSRCDAYAESTPAGVPGGGMGSEGGG